MFRHLLVPTDGSDLSEAAIRRAVSFARDTGASITFFHALESLVMPPHPSIYGDPVLLDPALVEQFTQAEKDHATELLGRARSQAEDAGVACDVCLSEHPVVHEAILETARARGCDLIFMASHGRRGLSGLLLGSETQRVLTHTTLPVLVFREPDHSGAAD